MEEITTPEVRNALTKALAEGLFLLLDASNGPITDNIDIDGDLVIYKSAWTISETCFTYGGNDYVAGAAIGGTGVYLWENNNVGKNTDTGTYDDAEGTTNISCGLYNLIAAGGLLITVYYMYGDKAKLEAFLTANLGAEGVGWDCDDYEDNLFTAAGVTSDYTFAGLPAGWTVTATYTTPPTCVYSLGDGITLARADGDITTYGDITGDNFITASGQIRMGGAGIPTVDYAVQGVKQVSTTDTGIAAGLNFLLQSVAASMNTQYVGIAAYNAIYVDGAYNQLTLYFGQHRLSMNNNTVGLAKGCNMQVAFTDAGGHGNNNSNVTTWKAYTHSLNQEGSGTGVIGTGYGYCSPANLGSVTVTTWYEIYVSDLSAFATTSWGIYNLDRTYLLKDLYFSTNAANKFYLRDTGLFIYSPSDGVIGIETDGTIRLGGSANYAEIEADGTIELIGDATVWDDVRVAANSVKAGGSAPGFETFTDGVKTYLFDKNTDEDVHFSVQLPHGYKQGTDISPHVHWAPMDTDTGSVTWKLEYTWANIDGTFSSTNTVSVTQAADGTALKHQMATMTSIDGSEPKSISSMLICRLYRDVDDGDDYDNDAALLEFDFHIEMDTIGSRQITTK